LNRFVLEFDTTAAAAAWTQLRGQAERGQVAVPGLQKPGRIHSYQQEPGPAPHFRIRYRTQVPALDQW
jgi:hypothetical protein